MRTAKEVEEALRKFSLQLPETDEAFPWGERAVRIRGKAFLFMRLTDGTLSFSVKLPRSRAQALALPFVEPTHYGLGKHGWVTIGVQRVTSGQVDQFKDWIVESFRAVAPKRVAESLDVGASQATSPRPGKRTKTAKS